MTKTLTPDPALYESMEAWKQDNDNTPPDNTRRGSRVGVTAGRTARAERQLLRDEAPEDVAEATGLRLNVVNAIAGRLAETSIEAEKSADPEAQRSRVRQEWLTAITECRLGDAPAVLLVVAENLFEARRYWEAFEVGNLAVVLLLRFRVMLIGGKCEIYETDPHKLLRRLRNFQDFNREDFRQASKLCGNCKRPRPRAENVISLGRFLSGRFADLAVDGEKPSRALPEALEQYGSGFEQEMGRCHKKGKRGRVQSPGGLQECRPIGKVAGTARNTSRLGGYFPGKPTAGQREPGTAKRGRPGL